MKIRQLPVLGSLIFSSLLTLGACGSSSSGSPGGATGSQGGTTGALGGTTGAAGGHVGSAGGSTGTGAGGATVTGSCTNIPSCVQFLSNCIPGGTCTRQMTGSVATGLQVNQCYGNGVKSSTAVTFDLTSGASMILATYSKGGSVCFTETIVASGAGGATASPTGVIKNAAGTTVATVMSSPDGTGTLLTCPGQAAVLLPDGCNMVNGMSTTETCTDGVCP